MCSLLRQGASLARSSPEDTAAVEAPEPKAIIISGPSQDQDPSNSITNCSITYQYLPRSFARVGGAALQRISECQLATPESLDAYAIPAKQNSVREIKERAGC
ncbi:hypothetical protein HBI80_081530 [Parastagonospora nodorum]|nr:hypothetical protein HBI80_081530 [Parastagonospora nodorum]